MKNSLLIISFSFYAFYISLAQISYTSSDYSGIGSNYQVVNAVATTGEDFTSTGENFIWDYPILAIDTPQNYGYEDPNNSPYKNIWCLYHLYIINCNSMFNNNFNLGTAVSQGFSLGDYTFENPYQHLQKTNTELQSKMFGANINLGGTTLPAILEYNDPDVLFKFPMQFDESYSDANSIDMNFSALGIDLIITSDGTRTNHVEGWGQLKIRNHVYPNTLKVKSSSVQNFNIYYEGQHNEVQLPSTTYYWFDKNYGIPVLMVMGIEIAGEFLPQMVSYIFQDGMSVNDFRQSNFILYPNPTTGKLNLKLSENEKLISIKIYNQKGKLMGTQLDLSLVPKGIYTIRIETSKGIYTDKIIRK